MESEMLIYRLVDIFIRLIDSWYIVSLDTNKEKKYLVINVVIFLMNDTNEKHNH